MEDKNKQQKTEKNKGLLYGGGCCGLIILIFVLYMFFGVSHPMDTNKTIEMYGVNITVPAEMQSNITSMDIRSGGKTYTFEDNNKNFTVYVTDDPSPEVAGIMNYDADLGYYGKTVVRGKTVVVYAGDSDTLERVLLSAS